MYSRCALNRRSRSNGLARARRAKKRLPVRRQARKTFRQTNRRRPRPLGKKQPVTNRPNEKILKQKLPGKQERYNPCVPGSFSNAKMYLRRRGAPSGPRGPAIKPALYGPGNPELLSGPGDGWGPAADISCGSFRQSAQWNRRQRDCLSRRFPAALNTRNLRCSA